MQRSKVKRFLQLAAEKAEVSNKVDLRLHKIGSVGIRTDGVTVFSKNKSFQGRQPKCHAEVSLLSKLQRNSTIFVSRMSRLTKTFAMARPCKTCMASLINHKICEVYYSVDHKSYGVISFNGKSFKERIHYFQ